MALAQKSSSAPPRRYRLMAMEKGPGPARYRLPSTVGGLNEREVDFTRHRNPAFSFGMKHKHRLSTADESPGPRYHSAAVRVTRLGVDKPPAYSMLGRPATCLPEKTPGPNAYKVEDVHPQGEARAPKWSFGSRTYLKTTKDETPGANSYTLPSLIGNCSVCQTTQPAYTMSAQLQLGGVFPSVKEAPGPASYSSTDVNNYKSRLPMYSLYSRNGPTTGNSNPGPGAYHPEEAPVLKGTKPPKFSFGIRHSDYLAPLLIKSTNPLCAP